ncbi:MAG: HNH endonuclease [Acidimicrobiales bacterium]
MGEAEAVEASLLEVAGHGNFGSLRTAAEQARQAARDEKAQADHLRRTRFFRKRRFDDGGVGGTFKLPPGTAAEVYAVLDAETDRQFQLARSEGRREGHDAYAADSLVEIVHRVGVDAPTAAAGSDAAGSDAAGSDAGPVEQLEAGPDDDVSDGRADGGTPRRAPRRVEVIGRVDLAALYRGHPMAGEVCEIAGVGAVPTAVIRDLLGEALLTLVLHDGVDVMNVTCAGRRGSKELLAAVRERDGYVCQTCGTPFGLQADHAEPVALDGETSYANLKHECRVCHRDKSISEAGITIRAGRERAEMERIVRQRLEALIAETEAAGPARGRSTHPAPAGPDPPRSG